MIAEPVGLHESLRPLRTSTYSLTFDRLPAMDLLTVDHHNEMRLRTKAVYELRGDVLTYCVARPGQPRPTALASTTGDGWTLVTLQRKRL